MTVAAPSRPANAKPRPAAEQRPGPRFIRVNQGQLVHGLMDLETLATEAIAANGYSLQTVMRLPAGTWRQEMQAAHIDTHDRLVRLLTAARLAAGRYDGRPKNGA